MLFSGGRILVAAVGAVVLAVVAVFILRSAWWDTAANEEPITPLTATTATATSEPETTSAEPNPGGNPDGNPVGDPGADPSGADPAGDPSGENPGADPAGDPAGGDPGGDPSGEEPSGGSPSEQDPTGQTAPYTESSKRIQRILGTVTVDVELPQIEGGNPDVANVFNEEMEKALQTQAVSLTSGTVQDRPGSGVRIGKQVLSGLLRTAATDFTTATSTALASTVVMDANSGSLITLSSLFKDLNKGLMKLQELTEELGPSTNAGSNFDETKLESSEKVFEHWTAETSGMRVYFAQGLVAPESEGIVDLTIPWDSLGDVLKPGVAQIVAG
jgi:hypothetical protein